jgi:hypothetical protein
MKLSALPPLLDAREELRRELNAALTGGITRRSRSAHGRANPLDTPTLKRAARRAVTARDRARKALAAPDRPGEAFMAQLVRASMARLPKVDADLLAEPSGHDAAPPAARERAQPSAPGGRKRSPAASTRAAKKAASASKRSHP